jgi:uncharacterized phiE125 gp8 family phage protein
MILTRIASPARLPVDRDMVWSHLNAILVEDLDSPPPDEPYDAALIDELIAAAVDRLDGPNGLLNRALITQTWLAQLPRFEREMRIPLPRCRLVSSITYIDPDGDSQAVALDAFRVVGLGTDHARIVPVDNWPDTARRDDAVAVTFVAGFGDAPDDVPGSIRLALCEMVATAYAHREFATLDGSFSTLPAAASRVVSDWTVWSP